VASHDKSGGVIGGTIQLQPLKQFCPPVGHVRVFVRASHSGVGIGVIVGTTVFSGVGVIGVEVEVGTTLAVAVEVEVGGTTLAVAVDVGDGSQVPVPSPVGIGVSPSGGVASVQTGTAVRSVVGVTGGGQVAAPHPFPAPPPGSAVVVPEVGQTCDPGVRVAPGVPHLGMSFGHLVRHSSCSSGSGVAVAPPAVGVGKGLPVGVGPPTGPSAPPTVSMYQ
jgi:hypothetical protein